MGKIVFESKETGISFRLKATNGEIIAVSETYKSMKSCKKGIASVQRNAPIAAVEDQTVENFEKCKHPKFEVYEDKGGKYRFRLKATNGQIIAVSQAYKSRKSCLNGAESVKKNAPDAKIEEITG